VRSATAAAAHRELVRREYLLREAGRRAQAARDELMWKAVRAGSLRLQARRTIAWYPELGPLAAGERDLVRRFLAQRATWDASGLEATRAAERRLLAAAVGKG
jgi:hypothetical protein